MMQRLYIAWPTKLSRLYLRCDWYRVWPSVQSSRDAVGTLTGAEWDYECRYCRSLQKVVERIRSYRRNVNRGRRNWASLRARERIPRESLGHCFRIIDTIYCHRSASACLRRKRRLSIPAANWSCHTPPWPFWTIVGESYFKDRGQPWTKLRPRRWRSSKIPRTSRRGESKYWDDTPISRRRRATSGTSSRTPVAFRYLSECLYSCHRYFAVCTFALTLRSAFSTLSEMRTNSKDGSTRSSKRPPMRVTKIRPIYRRRSRSTRPLKQKSPLIQTPSCCSIILAPRW